MIAPEFIVDAEARDPDGALLPQDVDRVGDLLLSGGFALLPSDTAYSAAVLPLTEATRLQLNVLLDRPDQPLSMAFPTAESVLRWAAPNPVAAALLERFCPGPITVVCRASYRVPAHVVDHVVAGKNHLVGFRIPNSPTERSAAASTSYPITTTALFEPGGEHAARTLDEARALIEPRIALTNFSRWCAVDGVVEHDRVSTVVRVNSDGRVDQIRAGPIPFEDIDECRDEVLREQR